MTAQTGSLLQRQTLDAAWLPDGATGVDAGLTLTKTVRATAGGVEAWSRITNGELAVDGAIVGATGARAAGVAAGRAVRSQEIDAAARGARAMLGADDEGPFVLTLLGTGTAFALVDGARVTHLGGAAIGGGSFAGIARRLYPALSYDEIVAAAARGDRRNADVMVSDAYPEGIGRIGPDLTAAHLAKAGDAGPGDVLAALLNLHGESIGQIAAARARTVQAGRIVLAGGFAHGNAALVASVAAMAELFGVRTDVVPAPGYTGAIGAALIAADAAEVRA